MVACLSLSLVQSVFAQTNISEENAQAVLLENTGITSYLDGNKILKVVVEAPKTLKAGNGILNADGTITATADVDIKYFMNQILPPS